MAISIENSKVLVVIDQSYVPSVDLTANQFCAVKFDTGVTTGEATVSLPAVGGRIAGIVKNPDASNLNSATGTLVRAVVAKIGMTRGRALGAINAGAELAVGDIYGRLTTATSGQYVVATAREAATVQDQDFAIELVGQYKI